MLATILSNKQVASMHNTRIVVSDICTSTQANHTGTYQLTTITSHACTGCCTHKLIKSTFPEGYDCDRSILLTECH